MMGYVLITGPCISCRRIFSYNPNHVPSVRMKNGREDPSGTREPICRHCVERANPIRIKNGLPPITPHPEAYEPLDERELRDE